MAIFSRDRSHITVNKAPSSSKKKKNTSNQSKEERSRSKSNGSRNVIKKGPTSTIRKKSAAVFPESYIDDHDEEDMWLSSDNTSISSFFDDQDTISGLFHLFDGSMLSNGGTTFFDGSMVYLVEELSSPCMTRRSILEMEMTFEEDLEDEEEVVNWLRSSAEDDDHTIDSSCWSDSSVMSSSSGHCHDETTTCDSSSVFDSTDFDSLSCWVSMMNLEEDEDLSHGSDGTDEPLFWPFERECDWSAVEEAFCMSPCSEVHKFRDAERPSPMSGLKARGRTVRQGYGSCRRRLVFDSTPETLKSKERRLVHEGYGFCDIEKRIGLCEFDGHEGVDQDFNKDDFVLL